MHVKVCLHMINHLATSLGKMAEKPKVASLETLSTEHQSEMKTKQLWNETESLWEMCSD